MPGFGGGDSPITLTGINSGTGLLYVKLTALPSAEESYTIFISGTSSYTTPPQLGSDYNETNGWTVPGTGLPAGTYTINVAATSTGP